MSSAGLLGQQRRVVSLGVHEEMTPSSVQISVGVASCYIHLFRWISTVVYGGQGHLSTLHHLSPFEHGCISVHPNV